MSHRQWTASVFTLALLAAAGSAAAQTGGSSQAWPVGTSLGGIGLTAPEGAECLVFPTGSTSLVVGATTFINLPSVFNNGGLTYYPPNQSNPTINYVGTARLTFATATSGRVSFDYYYAQVPITQPKPPAPRVTFSDYRISTSTNPPTLKLSVKFHVDGCTAMLNAIYHQP